MTTARSEGGLSLMFCPNVDVMIMSYIWRDSPFSSLIHLLFACVCRTTLNVPIVQTAESAESRPVGETGRTLWPHKGLD